MSDIRFNRWLHQSGTGGVYQDSAGNVGIGTSIPTTLLDIQGGNIKIGSNTLSSSGVSTFSNIIATSGSLTGITTIGVTTVTATSLNVNGNDYPSAGPLSNRNKITNGAMVVDQRNAGASVSVSGDGYGNRKFPVDRFNIQKSSTCVISGIKAYDAPTGQGFNYSLKAQVTTADASIAAADYGFISYRCEGYDVADFQFGTASAKTITISFWVKSSISGTYGFSLTNYADNRAIPINYSINSADTWEYKTITISGDTTGTWEKTNSGGMNIQWALGFGTDYEGTNNTWTGSVKLGTSSQTQWISTLNATFYLTGVQLEVGSVATPFEHRSYGDELARCQRYYYRIGGSSVYTYYGVAVAYSVDNLRLGIPLKVSMRTAPSSIDVLSQGQFLAERDVNLNHVSSSITLSGNTTTELGFIVIDSDTNFSIGGAAYNVYAYNTANTFVGFSAEL